MSDEMHIAPEKDKETEAVLTREISVEELTELVRLLQEASEIPKVKFDGDNPLGMAQQALDINRSKVAKALIKVGRILDK